MTDFSGVSEEDTQVEGPAQYRPDPPAMVEGRILHADADFYAYQAGYRWEEESLSQSITALKMIIESARIMAGAQTIQLHLTMGTKGGRYEWARLHEYQAQRGSRPEGLTDRVSELRHWMANCTAPGIVPHAWTDREADDGLTQRMHRAVADGTEHLNPMWSLDKDLYMAPGLHMNGETYQLEDFSVGTGYCVLDDSTSTKKVKGRGTSFFWHQLLMGDSADNIKGLPSFSVEHTIAVWPTQAMMKAEDRVKAARTGTAKKAALTALRKKVESAKPKKCGPVATHEFLERQSTDLEYFIRVRSAYADHYGPGVFEVQAWDGTVEQRTAGDIMLENARLLWMQRTPGEDVLDFFKEITS